MGAKLRPGNAHSADGVLDLISPLVDSYLSWFKQFWLRGDAAFASPGLYEFCEDRRITCFIRISSNSSLKRYILHAPRCAAGSPPKTGVQVRVIEFHYQAESWNKPRRAICKIEWHVGELFPRIGCLACNLLHMIRDIAFLGENDKPSIDSIVRRLVKVGARVLYNARKRHVHIASAFALARYYRILFA